LRGFGELNGFGGFFTRFFVFLYVFTLFFEQIGLFGVVVLAGELILMSLKGF